MISIKKAIVFWLQIDDTITKLIWTDCAGLSGLLVAVFYIDIFSIMDKWLRYGSQSSVASILHQGYMMNCMFNFLLHGCINVQSEPFSFLYFFGRTRSSSLFSPLNSSSDRVDVQLQSYHKAYSHQQMFAQPQGIDSRLVSSTAASDKQMFMHRQRQRHWPLPCTPLVVCQGCVYGEQKVIQPASSGGFEAASYFANTAASHSAGESSMCCSHNNSRMTQSAWN